MTDHDRLKSFLYILMRDELPTGKVEAVMQHLRAYSERKVGPCTVAISRKEVVFSAKHLEAYAAELASEILGQPESAQP